MSDVRRVLIEKKRIEWAYGCILNCLNNYFKQVVKACFVIAGKEALLISKTVRSIAMIWKLFEVVCLEKLQKISFMVAHSKKGGMVLILCSRGFFISNKF